MHLHILRPGHRSSGLGAQFVTQSATIYFRVLELQRLFSQPNALNVAPNRTLQRAGFKYVLSEHTIPGPINFPQVVTRWVLHQGRGGLALPPPVQALRAQLPNR